MNAPHILLSAENCWLVRSTMTWFDVSGKMTARRIYYYVTPSCWNRSPVHSTIFPSYEDAETHMAISHRDRPPRGWFDGREEVFDVVSLAGAVMASRQVASGE